MDGQTGSHTSFTLGSLIRRVLAESEAADPDVLVREVLARIGPADREAALVQALRSVVRETFRPAFIPDFASRTETPVPDQRHRDPSPRVAAIREAWQRTLSQRIAVQDGHKFLRDCTALDLEYAAARREVHARRVAARAADLRRIAEVMREHGAATLSDVPAEVLAGMQDALAQVAA